MTPAPTAPAATPEMLKVRRYSRLFVWTMIATWLLNSAPMIYRLGTLPLAMVAVAFGVLAFWSSFGVPSTGSLRIMLGMGGIGAGAFALLGVFWILIAPEVIKLDTCTRTSLTPQGERVCQQVFQDSMKAQYGFEVP